MILDEYISVGFHQLRFLPAELKIWLESDGLRDDLRQTVRLAAVEAWREREDISASSRRTQRELYRFLKNNGWHRPRKSPGYVQRDLPRSEWEGEGAFEDSAFESFLPLPLVEIGRKILSGELLTPTERTRLRRFRNGTYKRIGRAGRPRKDMRDGQAAPLLRKMGD